MSDIEFMIDIRNISGDDETPSILDERKAGAFHDKIDPRYSVRQLAQHETLADQRQEPAARIQFDQSSERQDHPCIAASWVAQIDDQIIGSISMVCVDTRIGRLEQFHVTPEWQADRTLARRLVRTAADFARERGLLKLMIEVPEDLPGLPPDRRSSAERAAEAQSRVKAYFPMLGFIFSRELKGEEGTTMLEFYLDLYQPPLIETGASSSDITRTGPNH